MNKLLKFRTHTCPKCNVLDMMIQQAELTLDITTIYADDDVQMRETYDIQSVPVLVLLNEHGAELKRHVGVMSPDEIKAFIYE